MPTNALVVAGGANAALEAHNQDLARKWLDLAKGSMNNSPQVMRERERYLTLKGDYADSAALGYRVLEKLPKDREGAVYLAYDLYNLGRYDEALALIKKYEPILPDDKDLPLVAGNIHAHDGKTEEALEEYTRALQLDPKMATGYVDRGFVLNDLKQPAKAVNDFQAAIKLQPDYGQAHLGLSLCGSAIAPTALRDGSAVSNSKAVRQVAYLATGTSRSISPGAGLYSRRDGVPHRPAGRSKRSFYPVGLCRYALPAAAVSAGACRARNRTEALSNRSRRVCLESTSTRHRTAKGRSAAGHSTGRAIRRQSGRHFGGYRRSIFDFGRSGGGDATILARARCP